MDSKQEIVDLIRKLAGTTSDRRGVIDITSTGPRSGIMIDGNLEGYATLASVILEHLATIREAKEGVTWGDHRFDEKSRIEDIILITHSDSGLKSNPTKRPSLLSLIFQAWTRWRAL